MATTTDNQCDRCGQWSGPGHACPEGKAEAAGGTGLLSLNGQPSGEPTPEENQATLRALPGYTEADVVFESGDQEFPMRVMARGLPAIDGRFGRRLTNLDLGTEMHLGKDLPEDPMGMRPISVDVDTETLPRCPDCGDDKAQVDGSACEDCQDLATCTTCGEAIDLDGWDGECGNCADRSVGAQG